MSAKSRAFNPACPDALATSLAPCDAGGAGAPIASLPMLLPHRSPIDSMPSLAVVSYPFYARKDSILGVTLRVTSRSPTLYIPYQCGFSRLIRVLAKESNTIFRRIRTGSHGNLARGLSCWMLATALCEALCACFGGIRERGLPGFWIPAVGKGLVYAVLLMRLIDCIRKWLVYAGLRTLDFAFCRMPLQSRRRDRLEALAPSNAGGFQRGD